MSRSARSQQIESEGLAAGLQGLAIFFRVEEAGTVESHGLSAWDVIEKILDTLH